MLAEGVLELWFQRFTEKRFEFILDHGLNPQSLQNLFDNLRVSTKKHELHERIANEIRDYVDRIDKIDEIIFMVADISAGIINRYFNSMGWDYYGTDVKERVLKANDENVLGLKFDRLENALNYTRNEEISSLFDKMKEYNEEMNKPVPNREVINRYPNFWNFNRWSELLKISFVANCDIPTYDVKANQALGEIIEKLEDYKFGEQALEAAT